MTPEHPQKSRSITGAWGSHLVYHSPSEPRTLCLVSMLVKNLICANRISDKGLILKTYKELIELNSKNTNKIGREPNILPKKTYKKTHMTNRYMKRCSTSLIIREMQIKTIVSPHS